MIFTRNKKRKEKRRLASALDVIVCCCCDLVGILDMLFDPKIRS